MKKIVIGILLMLTILIPGNIFAEEKEKVNVYFFKQSGCPHCQEAEEFFNSIEAQYGDLFNIVEYNIAISDESVELMEKVSEKLKDKADGVPYIIVGKESFIGFGDGTGDAIIEAIKTEYEKEERYNIIDHVDEKEPRNVVVDVAVLGGIVLVIGLVAFARYKNK